MALPELTYYCKVVADDGEQSKIGSFKVKDTPFRPIESDGVGNVRDIGGWATASGKSVKYGMIYRGGRLNDKVTEKGSDRGGLKG